MAQQRESLAGDITISKADVDRLTDELADRFERGGVNRTAAVLYAINIVGQFRIARG